MYQHLWDDALPYFSNNQWNFGRFLSHLDTLPHFPTDKKSRRELGTELWVSLLSKFAENDSHHENKFKAVQELAVSRPPPLLTTLCTPTALRKDLNLLTMMRFTPSSS